MKFLGEYELALGDDGRVVEFTGLRGGFS